MTLIAPSLLAADFTNLKSEIEKLNNSNCDYIHLDIMDGLFVPNISFGFDIIKQIRPLTDLYFDVHLMIERPEKYIDMLVDSGAQLITFHLECFNNHDYVVETIDKIKAHNVDVGISIKPNTDVQLLIPYLDLIDVVLIMSVEPGFGGQTFMPDQLEKVKLLNDLKDKHNFKIEIDGGINGSNYKSAISAGCDILVSGSYLFTDNMKEKISEMKTK